MLERLTTTSIQTHETESRLYYKEKSEEKMEDVAIKKTKHKAYASCDTRMALAKMWWDRRA